MNEVDLYLAQLDEALGLIKQECGSDGWWVVGGLANEAYFGGMDFNCRCSLHGLRDLDILCSLELLPSLYRARQLNSTPVFIDAAYHSLLQVHTTGEVWLKRGGLRLTVPAEIFKTQLIPWRGLVIPTLPPQTLQHIYCVAVVMCGSLRQKDWHAAKSLGRLAQRGGSFPTYPHEYFENFHQFLKLTGNNPGLALMAFRICKRVRLKRLLPLDHPKIQPFMQAVWNVTNGQ